jgi:serine/threonine-protein kinase RsbW
MTVEGTRMSHDERTIDIHLPSTLGYERVAMDAAGAAAKLIGFHDSRIEDLRTAVAEACINAIEHAHKFNSAMKVVVALKIEDGQLSIDVADQGGGIQGPVEPPDIEKVLSGERDARGWGMFLIKALMDEVQFDVKSEHGSAMRMVIRLGPADASDESTSAV